MSSVYLHRFNLARQPFALLPDADFFFEGERRGTLLHALQQAVQDDAGLCVVVGEVGTGKTMLCRMLARQLTRGDADVAFVPDASLPREALMASIATDLGLSFSEPASAVLALQQALVARSTLGLRLVLLIDEAHTMQPDALDAVRMLMNVETGQRKLLQIILFGQPELQLLMRRPDLRQVRDRIAHQFELQPLSEGGARAYLEHRLRQAGWRGDQLLEPGAMNSLVHHAAGRFRALGLLADKAFLAAYADGARSVAASHVKRAWRELAISRAGAWHWQPWSSAMARLQRLSWGPSLRTAAAMGGVATLGLVALMGANVAGDQLGQQLSTWQQQPVVVAKAAPARDYDALVAKAPPAAATPPVEPYFTLQLASVATEEIAEKEAERLAQVLGRDDLFVLHRPGNVDRKPSSLTPWVVCSGRAADAAPIHKAQAALPASVTRTRVLKVQS